MKSVIHPISKKTRFVLQILGSMIKSARIELNMSQAELGQRLNISRLTVIAIEKGAPGVSIGTVFEAAFILGIPLLNEDQEELKAYSRIISHFSSLLPKRTRRKVMGVDDDF